MSDSLVTLSRKLLRRSFLKAGAMGVAGAYMQSASSQAQALVQPVRSNTGLSCHTVSADGIEIFYRQAGPADAPVLLLLHGFPNSSHYFRALMPQLADQFRMIAPDFPAFGFTRIPPERRYQYSFESIANTLTAFTDALGLKRYAMYVFDYGAPIGFRHALEHPGRVTAYISQNGNAYEEGLGEQFWMPVRAYWKERTPAQREALRSRLTLDGVREAYLLGASNPVAVAPESYWLDATLMGRPGNAEIQLDLKLDYKSNIDLYPEFQAYFRKHRPPTLAIWGKYDPAFIPAGAAAFHRDIPGATVKLLEAGHFAMETETDTIAAAIREFRQKIPA
jgi:pimeloyl-ACP methyl ester carboxylesterase